MIDIESQEVTTTISMESGIISMAVNGRAIYCITMDNKLQMLNLSDQSVLLRQELSTTLSIMGDNHNVVSITTDDIHVPTIVYSDITWIL
jgi:hypothetical protein